MPSAVLWFPTSGFVDSDADRNERVNELIGGAALARWLSQTLRASGHDASEPWAEDHGWDFGVVGVDGKYLLTCTIEDLDPAEREACVQVQLGKEGRTALPDTDPVLAAVSSCLATSGAAIRREP